MVNADAVRVGDKLILRSRIAPVPDRIKPYLGQIVTVSKIGDSSSGLVFWLAEMGDIDHRFHQGCFDMPPDDPVDPPSASELSEFLGF